MVDGIADSMDLSLSKPWEMVRTGKPGVQQSTGLQGVRVTEQLNGNLSFCIIYDYFPVTVVKLSGCCRLPGLKYLYPSWFIAEKVGPSLALHIANL